MRTKSAFKMKQKALFINIQGPSVDKNYLRPKNASLTVLATKRGLLHNFSKTLKGRHFMGHSDTGLKFSIYTM